MCKLVFALIIVSITTVIIYAQKAEKQTKQDEQSLAAKSAEATVPKTAQAGNPNKTEVANKSDKPKPTKRPRRPPRRRRPLRRRRPRRRKRPRNRQKSTNPTARTVTKKTTNKIPQNTKKDTKVNEQNSEPTQETPVQVSAAIKQNTLIKIEDKTNKMKQVRTETAVKAENNLNKDVPLNNVMQPSQDIKEAVKQRVINEKSEAKPQVQAMKLAQSQADIPKANNELNSGKPNSDNSHSATGVKTSNEIKNKVEKSRMTRKITKIDNKPKKQIVSSVDKSMAEQEKFFDFFSFTTTEEPVLAAPPGIDTNKKPGKKVLPTVDPSKGVAHDGIRKLTLSRRMDLPTYISRTSRFSILEMLAGIFFFK